MIEEFKSVQGWKDLNINTKMIILRYEYKDVFMYICAKRYVQKIVGKQIIFMATSQENWV